MDYNDVPLFVRVVESGSFTAAAAALGREKSSVSRSIARLEEDLGVRLLQRSTRHLSLTEAGQTFYDRVRGALTGVDEAASAAQELGGEPRGVVRLTGPPDMDSQGLPEMLAEFMAAHPKIHVELSLTARAVDIIGEGFDLAIRGGKLADSRLVARRAGVTDLAIFASPSYLERRTRPASLADVAAHDCVLFKAHGGRTTWTMTGPDGEESVEVTGPLSADHMVFVGRAAVAGVGLALLPANLARGLASSGELEVVLPDYRISGAAVSVVLPSAAYVPARVALLRDFLVERMAERMALAAKSCQKHHGAPPSSPATTGSPSRRRKRRAGSRRRR